MTFAYEIKKEGNYGLYLFDASGHMVSKIMQGRFHNVGKFKEQFDVSKLAKGIYFCSLEGEEGRVVKKLITLSQNTSRLAILV